MEALPTVRGNGAFRLGEWVVRPSLNQLARGEGLVRLRPKVMDVLTELAAHAGQVISKEQILDAVWAKRFLGDTALSRAIFELREVLGDDPQHPSYIETIPKRGYRLIAPVQPADATPPPQASGVPHPASALTSRKALLLACMGLLGLVGFLALRGSGSVRRPDAQGPSVKMVVMPFENLGAPEDAYFAAGITEEISERLVAVQGISVISHDSAKHYSVAKLSDVDVGKSLGVDFVLGGAVRWERDARGSSRVRITPRLTRVADDTQVWASSYDRVLEDIFNVQSEIARSVITEIGVVAQGRSGAEVGRRPTPNLDAYQAFLRGHYYAADFYRPEEKLRLGLRMFERAVELDPGFAVAWGEIARVRAILYHLGLDRNPESLAEAKRALERALSLDGSSARIRYDAGLYYYWCYRDYARAAEEYSLARKDGGDSADLRAAEAYLYRRQGRWNEALRSLEAAAQLDPKGWTIFRELGITSLFMHRHEEAVRYLRQAIALAPDEAEPYGFLAETYWAWSGDVASAATVLAAMPRSDEPRSTLWRFWQDVFEGNPQAGLDRLLATSFGVVDDSENWESRSSLLARAYWLLGRHDEEKRESEKVRAELAPLLAQRPDDFSLHSGLGLCLARLGLKDEAIREGRRGVELAALKDDVLLKSAMAVQFAEILTVAGEPEQACAQLDEALKAPSLLSAALLRLDPTWSSLRAHACFATLLARQSGGAKQGDGKAARRGSTRSPAGGLAGSGAA